MKKFLCGLVFLIIIVSGIIFTVNYFLPKTEDAPAESQMDSNPSTAVEIDPVQEQLDSMTLDEKIAQMLVVRCPSIIISPEEQELLKTTPYGGYILMEEAYGTLSETRSMIENLQSFAKTPLIITTDQEGGLVQRIKGIKDQQPTDIPDMFSVGETGDTNYAKNIGRVLAEELRVIGINVDLAPDADVYSNPYNTVIGRRSFSSDPEVVAKMSWALAEGLEQNGVSVTFKHFPGHGNTEVDSHKDLPAIYSTREQLDAVDLVPFKNAIKNNAEFIMVGHLALPELTGDYTPATLSHQITTELLRNELGYQNLIITDGLDMEALTKYYSETDIYAGAVEAGADLLLLPINPELAVTAIRDNISESRINESVYRILKYKQTYLKDYQYLDFSYFGSPEHADVVTLR